MNGRVRAQLSLVEKPLLGGRHVSAPMLGHHQVLEKYLMRKLWSSIGAETCRPPNKGLSTKNLVVL
jgi:hypothetical protein